jgi:superfamily II RNA helicase
MRRGIAYHHSGLIPILKEIVEIIFGRGLIKVLFATETFAVGVNMPTKTVIFTELEKFDNSGRRYLRTDEYLQMSGRAGRRGLDKVGTVILVPAMVWPDRDILKNMMTGKSPSINSRFVPTYQFILKTMMSSQEETKTDLFLDKTYRSLQDKKERDNLLINMDGLREELRKIEEDNAEMFVSNFVEKMKMYDKNRKKLEDRFMVLKGKDRKRVEDEQRKIESEYGNFGTLKEKWMEYEEIRKELEEMNSDYEYFETYLGITSEKMKRMLVELEYITEENEIKEKGITAMNIGEVDELMLTEMIHRDMLEGLSMEEIITVLAIFIDEIDKTQEERYIQDLDIHMKIT